MFGTRCRCNGKLSVKNLVTISIVGQKTIVFIGKDDFPWRYALSKSGRHGISLECRNATFVKAWYKLDGLSRRGMGRLSVIRILFSAVFFTVGFAPAYGADKMRIYMTGFAGQFMTFPLAQKRGFLKEEGIEAEIVRISAAAGRAALINGDIDYSTGIGGTAINGALSGIPIRVVACFVPAPVLGLVARPEFKTVQALKGKTIAILIPGGVAHFTARAMVKHAVSIRKRK